MRTLLIFVLAFFLYDKLPAQIVSSRISDQVIIKFKEGIKINPICTQEGLFNSGIPELDEIDRKCAAVDFYKLNTGRDSKDQVYVIKYKEGTEIEKIIIELNKTGLFDYAEPDYIGSSFGTASTTPNDTYFSRQWGLYNDGTFSLFTGVRAGADIKMKDAWDIEQGSPLVKVGFIDSGCKLDHPEFSGRIWVNSGEIPNNGVDDDGNGYIDDVHGWDFVNNDNNPTDDYGHGTNTTGITGANGNNNTGYAGVDWNCKLMICKGTDVSGNGYYSWWVSAISYLTDNGVSVINLSEGGTGSSSALQNAVNYAYNHNVLIVASMGDVNSNTPYYPAACNHVMAVGATNPDDNRCTLFSYGSGGSTYGSNISVCAPGNYIYAVPYNSNTVYDANVYWGGTSESAPYVTGLAALLKAQDSTRTPDQIRSIIETTADDQVGNPVEDTPGWDQYYGFGRINAYKALSVYTSVKNIENSLVDFTIYPNPAYHQVQVVLKHLPVEASEINVTDITGKVVWKKETIEERTLCNFNFSPGVYFVSIQSSSFRVTKKLLIFQLY